MSYQFHGQRPHEEVVLISHPHPFVLLTPFIIAALLLLVPILAIVFWITGIVLSVLIVVPLIAAISVGATAYHEWSHTLFLVTNERVVFMHQKGLLRREVGECALGSIQQVSHRVQGLLHTIWGYGTITIAAGAQGVITVPDVPEPYEIQQEIQRLASGASEFVA